MDHPLVFLDTETTGTDPDRHEVWELAALIRGTAGAERVLELQVRVERIGQADPGALEVGGFSGRYRPAEACSPEHAARRVAAFCEGAVLCGLNVSFDVGFLRPLLGAAGLAPTWHYSPLDVKSFAAGAAGLVPPWRSDEIAGAFGIDPGSYARHSALADCRYAADIYRAALERRRRPPDGRRRPPASVTAPQIAPPGFHGRFAPSAEGFRAPRPDSPERVADLARRVSEIAAGTAEPGS